MRQLTRNRQPDRQITLKSLGGGRIPLLEGARAMRCCHRWPRRARCREAGRRSSDAPADPAPLPGVEGWPGTPLERRARGVPGGETPGKARPHPHRSAGLQPLARGEPVGLDTVRREMGHGDESLVRHIYGHLGTIRHRAPVVEYRVAQHLDLLGERLARVWARSGGPVVTTADTTEGAPLSPPARRGAEVAGWHTQRTQNPPGATPCEFDSRLGHMKDGKTERRKGGRKPGGSITSPSTFPTGSPGIRFRGSPAPSNPPCGLP